MTDEPSRADRTTPASGNVPGPPSDRMLLRMREFRFAFPRPALVMGIVNVTPDSFSDGGQFFAPEAAVAHGVELAAEGAEIIDVGGESTRPGAAPVEEGEELRRVVPVVADLAARINVPISIDTRKPAVARAAIAAGASVVNDVGAHREDAGMAALVAETGAGYVVMHMKGTPATMQQEAVYSDVVREVGLFFANRLEWLQRVGVPREQVVLDVGIGFAKTSEHNLRLIGSLKYYTKYQRPLLLGVSRKSFIGKLLGAEMAARLPGGLACACWAIQAGVQIIRTHEVKATVQALRMTEALLAHQEYGLEHIV